MTDFRKKMHIAYKQKLVSILSNYTVDLFESIEQFNVDPELFITQWIDRNCLPMGDFCKEDAIKEIEEWQK